MSVPCAQLTSCKIRQLLLQCCFHATPEYHYLQNTIQNISNKTRRNSLVLTHEPSWCRTEISYLLRLLNSLSPATCLACTTGLHSITRSQQPPQRADLSHADCFSQCELVGWEVIYDYIFIQVIQGWPGGCSHSSSGETCLASARSSICEMCPNKDAMYAFLI